jgi:hypothetical protein
MMQYFEFLLVVPLRVCNSSLVACDDEPSRALVLTTVSAAAEAKGGVQ